MSKMKSKKHESPKWRAAVAGLYQKKATPREIAEALGVPLSAVSGDIVRLVEKWRERFDAFESFHRRHLAELEACVRECERRFDSTKNPIYLGLRRLAESMLSESRGN